MTAIVDAGPLVCIKTPSPDAALMMAALRREPGLLIIPAPVTAEVDYLLSSQAGDDAARAFLEDISAGRFVVEFLTPDEYGTVLELSRRYRHLRPGLADLSIVVLAHRFGTHRVLTIDQRHFRAMTALDGQPFTLLPWDEQ